MTVALDRPVGKPHDHVVNLYDDYADVVRDVGGFLVEGLLAGEVAVVIGTAEHRAAFDRAMGGHVDLELARREGRYVAADAWETLASFRVAGRTDPERFGRVIGGLLGAAAADGRPVRAFGEMVALLWDAGEVSEAIELESMWNALAPELQLSLRCAYPMASLGRSGDLRAVQAVCRHHSSVTVPGGYRSDGGGAPIDGTDGRSELFIVDPLAVRAVRRFVVGALSDAEDDKLMADAVVVASELATNVVRHVGSPFRVTVRRSALTVTVAVEDLSPNPPVLLDVTVDAIGGRGVRIVEAMCSRWGTDVGPAGKVVWAELARR